MTGEELYTKYLFAMADQGFHIDAWDDLGQNEQEVWNALAEDLVSIFRGGKEDYLK